MIVPRELFKNLKTKVQIITISNNYRPFFLMLLCCKTHPSLFTSIELTKLILLTMSLHYYIWMRSGRIIYG